MLRRSAVSLVTAITMVALALATAGCASKSSGSGAAGSTQDGATLVRERCTRCHSIERIEKARHDKAGWQARVGRMLGKGAHLSEAEAAAVVEYLSTR